MENTRNLPEWPVLTSYDRDYLNRIALPLGGLGTGTISLGGRGNLRDFEIQNQPNKGFTPDYTFFALHVDGPQGAITRLLEGPLPPESYEGQRGSPEPQHGWPRFRECSFQAAYPLGQVHLSDPDLPVSARLQAFNPLVPADTEASGLPLAVLRYVVTNHTGDELAVSICGNTQNLNLEAGYNHFKTAPGLSGLLLTSPPREALPESGGTLALCTTVEDVTSRRGWPLLSWGDSLLDYWDDFHEDGQITQDRPGAPVTPHWLPVASLCARQTLAPRETRDFTFFFTWHFPDRQTWTGHRSDGSWHPEENTVGNYYANGFEDAWAAARHCAGMLPELEARTVEFVDAFVTCDLPQAVKEAALNNLSTLRTETCFRTKDGHFFGFEGCHDKKGSCYGNCTHVWNYEQATAHLFGSLARSMREVEFLHATRANGFMPFRINLPLSRAQDYWVAAADGQMGCLMKLYRDWQLSGDEDFLRRAWPGARRALEFCWIPGGWDADQDGVMEGCQHNTMDVEYFGPNPQMGTWYLGALRAAEEMAGHLGEAEFADRCRRLFEHGSRWLDANLFNGEYYEHQVWPMPDASAIAPGLRSGMGAENLADPELQLGSGCLVDQLAGQFMAHVCGLGYLLDEEHVKTTLSSLTKYNLQPNLWGHFNHRRTYALGDESAMLMATYPRGRRPRRPFPYYNEVMTGFEYTAAVHQLYEGQTEAGLGLIAAIRARYDGRKRNPFDEAEAGHHYARAMTSWAAVLALTGFAYSGVTGTMTFRAAEQTTTWFWSTGDAWGTIAQEPGPSHIAVELRVLGGTIHLKELGLRCYGHESWTVPAILKAGSRAIAIIHMSQGPGDSAAPPDFVRVSLHLRFVIAGHTIRSPCPLSNARPGANGLMRRRRPEPSPSTAPRSRPVIGSRPCPS